MPKCGGEITGRRWAFTGGQTTSKRTAYQSGPFDHPEHLWVKRGSIDGVGILIAFGDDDKPQMIDLPFGLVDQRSAWHLRRRER